MPTEGNEGKGRKWSGQKLGLGFFACAFLILTIVGPISSGCSLLASRESAPPGTPACQVTMVNSRRQMVGQTRIAIRGPTTISQVLRESKAYSRFGRVEAELVRDGKRMKANFKGGKLDLLSDYAVFPGDHLLIIEDRRTFLDDTIDQLGGQFVKRFAKP